MAEEKNVNVNSEEIKSETKSTVNDVKETMKNVNIKDDAKSTTNFVTSMFKKPLETLRKLAGDEKNKSLKHTLLLVLCWLIVILIKTLASSHWAWSLIGHNLLSVIKDLLAPVCGLFAISVILYFMQNDEKKSLTTIFTTITMATTPVILVEILSILTLFSRNFYSIITPLRLFASAITIVYIYFASKLLIGNEENSKFINRYTIAQGIYFIVYFVLSFLEIYIPML